MHSNDTDSIGFIYSLSKNTRRLSKREDGSIESVDGKVTTVHRPHQQQQQAMCTLLPSSPTSFLCVSHLPYTLSPLPRLICLRLFILCTLSPFAPFTTINTTIPSSFCRFSIWFFECFFGIFPIFFELFLCTLLVSYTLSSSSFPLHSPQF